MKNLYILFSLLIAGCAPKQQDEVQVAETKEVGNTSVAEGYCNKCEASKYAESEPDTAFIFFK